MRPTVAAALVLLLVGCGDDVANIVGSDAADTLPTADVGADVVGPIGDVGTSDAGGGPLLDTVYTDLLVPSCGDGSGCR